MSKPVSVLLGALKAVVAAVAGLVITALTTGTFDWRAIAAAAASALVVYFVPNFTLVAGKLAIKR